MRSIKSYQLLMVKDSSFKAETKQVAKPDDVATILQSYLRGREREHFVVIALNTRNKIIGIHTVSIGSLDTSIVHPREVFKFAILANASSVILGHNHPSGDTTPSPEDIDITHRLVKAGELLGIEVLDHLIVGNGRGNYHSMKRQGEM